MNRARRSNEGPRLELTPLMDMMFLLLTFFIFAFAVILRLEVTDIRLPSAVGGATPERTPAVVVSLGPDGSIRVDDEPADLADLGARVAERMAAAPNTRLFVATDQAAPAGELFRLMDALQAAGFNDLRFLRSPESGAESGAEAGAQPTAAPGP